MLLVIMVLGVLLIPKIPEKWFRFLFLACIVMNAIYKNGTFSHLSWERECTYFVKFWNSFF